MVWLWIGISISVEHLDAAGIPAQMQVVDLGEGVDRDGWRGYADGDCASEPGDDAVVNMDAEGGNAATAFGGSGAGA